MKASFKVARSSFVKESRILFRSASENAVIFCNLLIELEQIDVRLWYWYTTRNLELNITTHCYTFIRELLSKSYASKLSQMLFSHIRRGITDLHFPSLIDWEQQWMVIIFNNRESILPSIPPQISIHPKNIPRHLTKMKENVLFRKSWKSRKTVLDIFYWIHSNASDGVC